MVQQILYGQWFSESYQVFIYLEAMVYKAIMSLGNCLLKTAKYFFKA